MKLLILVVLYKLQPQESSSLQTLALQNHLCNSCILIWDNSSEACSSIGHEWIANSFVASDYHHTPQNVPLSKIYNTVIDRWIKPVENQFTHLLLLDQDSHLSPAFLQVVSDSISAHPDRGLFLPIVKSVGRIVSPADLFYFKGTFWKSPYWGDLPLKFKTAINSGMVISAQYLRDKFTKYPEELSFYGTDTWFCEQYADTGGVAYVIDTLINHDLSQFNEESVEIKLWRYREINRATRIINRRGFFRRTFCNLYLFIKSVKLALRFRDRRFIAC